MTQPIMTQQQIYLEDEAATLLFGRRLAQATFANPELSIEKIVDGQGVESLGAVVHLSGELGAGKTTLSRGILRGYGYQGAVKSPTYTIVEPYEFELCQLYHFDLYRLADPEEIEYLGTESYFSPTSICIVEWAERGGNVIPRADLKIDIEIGNGIGNGIEGTGRRIICQSLSERGELISTRLWT